MTREETQVIYAQLETEALYALRSLSRDLVYQCYGKVKMAQQLLAIDAAQAAELNTLLVRNGLNNPQYVRETYARPMEVCCND